MIYKMARYKNENRKDMKGGQGNKWQVSDRKRGSAEGLGKLLNQEGNNNVLEMYHRM